jgi:hypothetical protein
MPSTLSLAPGELGGRGSVDLRIASTTLVTPVVLAKKLLASSNRHERGCVRASKGPAGDVR